MDAFEAIKATFFQECDELLAELESKLMLLEQGQTDLETINAVFRAVHSIKGGAAAFGLTSVVEFAHVFETVLDLMRSGRLPVSLPAMQTLLRASDVLADLVTVARDGGADPPQMASLLMELDLLAEQGPAMLDKTVGDVMTSPPITVSPSTDILEALGLMTRRRIRHLVDHMQILEWVIAHVLVQELIDHKIIGG